LTGHIYCGLSEGVFQMLHSGSVKHFATYNGIIVELLQADYADFRHDYERYIGRPYAGEKLVREC